MSPNSRPFGAVGKGDRMNLRIRYDEKFQTLVLDDDAAEEMWVSLGIEDEAATPAEKEKVLQEKFDVEYNRPDYNNWHKYWRHHGNSKAQPSEEEDEVDTSEPLMNEVADDRIFRKDELTHEEAEADEATCQWICRVLCKKPDIAEAFIATKYGDTTIREYVTKQAGPDASQEDIKKLENSLSKKLTRAAKVLAEAYPDRDF